MSPPEESLFRPLLIDWMPSQGTRKRKCYIPSLYHRKGGGIVVPSGRLRGAWVKEAPRMCAGQGPGILIITYIYPRSFGQYGPQRSCCSCLLGAGVGCG